MTAQALPKKMSVEEFLQWPDEPLQVKEKPHEGDTGYRLRRRPR